MWQLHCDKCKKELPIIKKKILGQEKEFYDKGVVNVPFEKVRTDGTRL